MVKVAIYVLFLGSWYVGSHKGMCTSRFWAIRGGWQGERTHDDRHNRDSSVRRGNIRERDTKSSIRSIRSASGGSRGTFRRQQTKRREMTAEQSVKYAFRPDATSPERKSKIAQWNRRLAMDLRERNPMSEMALIAEEAANQTAEILETRNKLKEAFEARKVSPPFEQLHTKAKWDEEEDKDDPLAFLLDDDFEGPWIPDRKRPLDTGWDVPPEDPSLPLTTGGGSIAAVNPSFTSDIGANGRPATLQAQRLLEHQLGRVYVGNLPETNVEELRDFFNKIMAIGQGPLRKPGNSIIQVFYNPIRRYGFLEMRELDEALQALDLDGITYKGVAIKVGRPGNFNTELFDKMRGNRPPPPKLELSGQQRYIVRPDYGPERLHVSGIPIKIEEPHVRQLLEAFGPLQGLYYPKDDQEQKGETTAWALCLYKDPKVNPVAIKGLNGLEVMGCTLSVRIAIPGQDFPAMPVNAALIAGESSQQAMRSEAVQKNEVMGSPTNILVLLNMVVESELEDDNEYNEIVEDVQEECEKFGVIKKVLIPRPGSGLQGVGKVFVQFVSPEAGENALISLRGRKFASRTVDGGFWPIEQWENLQLDNLEKKYWSEHKDIEGTKESAVVEP